MEQLHGCPEHRDGMFLLLCPVHLSSVVWTVAAVWEGSSCSRGSRSAASCFPPLPLLHKLAQHGSDVAPNGNGAGVTFVLARSSRI